MLVPVAGDRCWFFFTFPDGKISKDDIILFLIMNMPWLIIWTFYYFRMNRYFNINDH